MLTRKELCMLRIVNIWMPRLVCMFITESRPLFRVLHSVSAKKRPFNINWNTLFTTYWHTRIEQRRSNVNNTTCTYIFLFQAALSTLFTALASCLLQIVSRYSLVVVLEVMDQSGKAIDMFLTELNASEYVIYTWTDTHQSMFTMQEKVFKRIRMYSHINQNYNYHV